MPRKYTNKIKPLNRSKGSFRIIAGDWRSRRFEFEEQEGLRPTTDRVRETVFNWLAPYITGSRVLDLFAGSGVLGLEALSRGASQCTFIENNRVSSENINAILRQIGSDKGEVHQIDALQWISQSEEVSRQLFDIVFIDPPFRKGLLEESLDKLENSGLIATDALIYVETEKELKSFRRPANWTQLKEKQMGQVCYRLFQGDS